MYRGAFKTAIGKHGADAAQPLTYPTIQFTQVGLACSPLPDNTYAKAGGSHKGEPAYDILTGNDSFQGFDIAESRLQGNNRAGLADKVLCCPDSGQGVKRFYCQQYQVTAVNIRRMGNCCCRNKGDGIRINSIRLHETYTLAVQHINFLLVGINQHNLMFAPA